MRLSFTYRRDSKLPIATILNKDKLISIIFIYHASNAQILGTLRSGHVNSDSSADDVI